jgi:hypothetical protein
MRFSRSVSVMFGIASTCCCRLFSYCSSGWKAAVTFGDGGVDAGREVVGLGVDGRLPAGLARCAQPVGPLAAVDGVLEAGAAAPGR